MDFTVTIKYEEIPENTPESLVRCSFCGKSNKEVKCIVQGPGMVSICNECVNISLDAFKKNGVEI